jgi:DNA-binding NarL/FixJ family response regulator
MAPASVKSCYRCGSEFRGREGERVCPGCRKPVARRRRLVVVNSELTHRELQIAGMVADAKLNKEIAGELHLTEGTIKEYLNRIFRKVGARNRVELAVMQIKKASAANAGQGC